MLADDEVVLRLKESSDSKLKGKFCSLITFALEAEGDKNFPNFKTFAISYFNLHERILEASTYRQVFNLIGQEKKWDYKNYTPLIEFLNQFLEHQSSDKCHDYEEAFAAYYHATRKLTETMLHNNLTKMCCEDEQHTFSNPNFHMKLHPHKMSENSMSYVCHLWSSMSRYFSLPSVKTVIDYMPTTADAEVDCLCATFHTDASKTLRHSEESWKRFMAENSIKAIHFDDGRFYSV